MYFTFIHHNIDNSEFAILNNCSLYVYQFEWTILKLNEDVSFNLNLIFTNSYTIYTVYACSLCMNFWTTFNCSKHLGNLTTFTSVFNIANYKFIPQTPFNVIFLMLASKP